MRPSPRTSPALKHLATSERAYVAILNRALWPAMNLANGTTIPQKLRLLERSQWSSREELEVLQLRKLRQLIHHAGSRVPYYREQMKEHGFAPDSVRSLQSLRSLPTVDKPILKRRALDFLAEGQTFRGLVAGTTSGSTGQPTRFFRSREQESWHWALKYRMWGMSGYTIGAPYVNIYNMARPGWKKALQDRLLRNTPIYLFAGADQEQQIARVVQALRREHIQFVASCTASLKMVADYLAKRGEPPPTGLPVALTTGSILTEADRLHIEATLSTSVWDHYGLGGEGAHVAAECEEKRGYHINVENLLVEPRNPACIDTGDPTEIIVTVLDNYAWPLIRYATGDYGVFSSRTCPCGRGLPLLERVDGRVSDILTLPNGVQLNVHFFSVLVGRHETVLQYQVEQVTHDRIVFQVVWRDEDSPHSAISVIRKKLQEASEGTVSVEFRSVSEIPLPPSGKHRYVIPLGSRTAGAQIG